MQDKEVSSYEINNVITPNRTEEVSRDPKVDNEWEYGVGVSNKVAGQWKYNSLVK